MMGMLILLLLVFFSAGKNAPKAPQDIPPPPPYRSTKPEKEDKRLLTIVIIVIVVFVVVPIIITIVLAGMLYFWVSTWAPPKIETPSANLSTPMKNVTASTYYYNMTVLNTSEPIEPKYVRVEFYSFFTLYGRVNLSATRGEYKQVKEYDERDYDIYVMWQDTNLNNKLDANDEISIKSTSGLDWQKVKLWYDRPWAWGTIAEVELP